MLIFFDVNTQNDFINLDGALVIENADTIRPNLKKLTEFARNNNIQIIASVDKHYPKSVEMMHDNNPYHNHCVNGTAGQRKIEETRALSPLFIENRDYNEVELKESLLNHKGEIIIEKQTTNVFDNKNLKKILDFFNVRTAVIYGVNDHYIRPIIDNLIESGVDVMLVDDAIKTENDDSLIDDMKQNNLKIIKTDELLQQLSQT